MHRAAAQQHTLSGLQAPSRQNKEIIDGAQGKLAALSGRRRSRLQVQQTSCNMFDPIFNILGREGVVEMWGSLLHGFPLKVLIEAEKQCMYILFYCAKPGQFTVLIAKHPNFKYQFAWSLAQYTFDECLTIQFNKRVGRRELLYIKIERVGF